MKFGGKLFLNNTDSNCTKPDDLMASIKFENYFCYIDKTNIIENSPFFINLSAASRFLIAQVPFFGLKHLITLGITHYRPINACQFREVIIFHICLFCGVLTVRRIDKVI